MYQIDNATAVETRPTPSAVGPNPNGFFTNGNPGFVAPTNVDQDWLNAVQQELIAVVEAAGLTPSKTALNQVLEAIQALIAVETSRAETAESALGTRITNETSRAESEEGSLQTQITAEISRAEAAEATKALLAGSSSQSFSVYNLTTANGAILSDTTALSVLNAAGTANVTVLASPAPLITNAVTVMSQFASTLTANGIKYIPDGNSPSGYFVLIWGEAQTVDGTGVVFTEAFPTLCLAITISESEASAPTWAAGNDRWNVSDIGASLAIVKGIPSKTMSP